jgi:hypothetical protein
LRWATFSVLDRSINMKKYSILLGIAFIMASGLSACSSPLEGPGAKPPAPGKPSLTAGNGSLYVSWGELDMVDSYRVYCDTSQTPPAAPVQSVSGTSATVTGLTNDTTYYVWVQALNERGASPLSAVASMTLSLQAPAAPTLHAGSGSLTVSWPPVGLAASYNLYYSTEATLPDNLAQSGITTTSTTITGLSNDTTYYVWIEAVNAGGTKMGERSSMTLSLQTPAAPVLSAGVSGFMVSWPAVDLADSYNVYYSTGETPPASTTLSGLTETTITITELINDTTYYVWIEAVNAGGTKLGTRAQGRTTSGSYTVFDTATFTQAIAAIKADATGGSYTITLTGSFASANVDFTPNAIKTITIKGDTGNKVISNSGDKELFIIQSGITLVLDTNSTMSGNSKRYSVVSVLPEGKLIMKQGSQVAGANATGITVDGGAFTMEGGTISGNTTSAYYSGGVYIAANGTFTMSGGTISGNTTSASHGGVVCGGGVYSSGVFNMSGGTISGNTASAYYDYAYGGGVYSSGVFTMSGGTISGNTATSTYTYSNSFYSVGGGVYSSGTFRKEGGGTIDATNSATYGKVAYVSNGGKKRNTIAGPTVNLNSDIPGSAGGWE